MTLKEKFEEYTDQKSWQKENYDAIECAVIADDFAIKFNDWVNVNAYKFPTKITTKELLEIYKKENKL